MDEAKHIARLKSDLRDIDHNSYYRNCSEEEKRRMRLQIGFRIFKHKHQGDLDAREEEHF